MRKTPSRTSTSLFAEFLRDPRRTGTVAASSRWLARRITRAVPASGAPLVVELGPGTGAFTAEITRRLNGRGQQLAVEANPRFAAALSTSFPELDVAEADAADLRQLLDERGLGQVDTVVSGLPWSSFTDDTQRRLLDAVASCLAPGGAFTTFTYVHAPFYPPARRFRRRLDDRFDTVVTSRVVWRNLPPAYVYTAHGPRLDDSWNDADPGDTQGAGS